MESRKLVDELARFGLTSHQARAYIFILETGLVSASQVAKMIGMNRSDTYRVLEELLSLGMLERHLFRPMLFSSVSPETALRTLVRLKREEIDELSRRVEKLTDLLGSVKRVEKEKVEEPKNFRVFIGSRGLVDALRKMFRGAGKAQLILDSAALSSWLARGMDDVLEDSVKKGTNVTIITKIEDANLEEMRKVSALCHLRHGEDIPTSIAIIDGKEALFGSQAGNKMEIDSYETYLWINDPTLVNILEDYFERLWKDSINAREKIRSLRQRNLST